MSKSSVKKNTSSSKSSAKPATTKPAATKGKAAAKPAPKSSKGQEVVKVVPPVVTPEETKAIVDAVAKVVAEKPPVVAKSTVADPVHFVWDTADKMRAADPKARRCEIVAFCIKSGVATHTARTQFQRWHEAQKASKK